MRSFWDCKQCQEEYKRKAVNCITVGDYAMLLEKQEEIHIRGEHNLNE